MDYPKSENARGDTSSQTRLREINAYLDKPIFEHDASELSDISLEERKWLAHSIKDIYVQAKKETDKRKRLQLMSRFRDSLTLLLCDPKERRLAYSPPAVTEKIVFYLDDCLSFGTGTIGERIFFKTYTGQERAPGRYMEYPVPTDSSMNLGRKYYQRFCYAFGANQINLDAESIAR